MRVLIVEDEPIIRQGIINKVDWAGLGAVLVGEAGNGAEGLEVLKNQAVDLVLVDIRMPIMDGPAFIRQASARYPDLQMIVISGFNDFEYARQAIRYGVKEYLLKPVDAEELNSRLQNLIALKDQQDRQQAYVYRLQRHYDHEQEELRALYLTRFLTDGVQPPAAEAAPLNLQAFHDPAALVVLELEPVTLPFRSFGIGDEWLLWYGIRNIVEECMASSEIVGITFRHAAQASHFVVIQQTNGEHWVQEAIDALERTLQIKATAAIRLLAGDGGGLARAYGEAAERLQDKLLYGTGRVFRGGADALPRALLAVEQERVLGSCLLNGRKDELRQELERIVFGWFEMPGATFRLVMKGCGELEQIYRYYASDMEKLPHSAAYWAAPSYDDAWTQVLGLPPDPREVATRLELLEELYARGCKVMELRALRGQKTGKSIVAEVKEYIDQNYYLDLSLNWVAEHYYIHAKYFARLFKETFGETFTEYIMRLRLEKACELLQNGAYTVREIAKMIGYDDPSYFAIVFRKHTGYTPTQYRESRNSQVTE